MDMEAYIAHTRDDGETQPLLCHLTGTADLARENASGWGEDFAYCCGLAHDIGKYSEAFQKRIRNANVRVDHSTGGGQALCPAEAKSALGMLAAYCVMGHHGGLPNGGVEKQALDSLNDSTLHGRFIRTIENCEHYKKELQLPALTPPALSKKWRDGFDAAFFVRMAFSALVDADRLDTERFCNHGNEPRGGFLTTDRLFHTLYSKLERYLNAPEPISGLNRKRNELLRDCLTAADSPAGLFKLTAPTGSGKTIASLAFALKHAVKTGLKRVIYVIPYNSIIDQNAAVFEDLLGKENVLCHNSDIQYDGDDEESKNKRFSVENWDFPIMIHCKMKCNR